MEAFQPSAGPQSMMLRTPARAGAQQVGAGKVNSFLAHTSQIHIRSRPGIVDAEQLNRDLEGVTDYVKRPNLKVSVPTKPLKLKPSQKYKGKFLVAEKNVTPKEIKEYIKNQFIEIVVAHEPVYEDSTPFFQE